MAIRGFTLAELMIVLVIGAILLAIGIPAVDNYVQRMRISQGIAELADNSTRISKFEMSMGKLPDSINDVEKVVTTDPWGRPYEYFNLRAAKGNGQARKDKKLAPLNSDFDLYSVGRDGETQASLANAKSRDDIVRARDGRFIGTAEEFDP